MVSVSTAGVCWGTSFPAVFYLLKLVSPFQLMFVRFTVATLLSLVFFWRLLPKILTTRSLWLLGLVNGAAYSVQFVGQQWVPAGQASIFATTYPLFIPLTAHFILGDALTLRKIMSSIIGFSGVVLMMGGQSGADDAGVHHSEYILGCVLITASGVIWAVYATLVKKVQTPAQTDGEYTTSTAILPTDNEVFVASLFFTMLVSFVYLPHELSTLDDIFETRALTAGVYLAVFCTVIPFLLYVRSVKEMDVTFATLVLLLQVIISFVISVTLLDEHVGVFEVAGASLIVTAIFLAASAATQGQDEIPVEP